MSARQLDLFSVENTEVYRQALSEGIGVHTPLTEPVSGRGETFVNVQRQFEKAGQFNFMGAEKIASPRDVAYIFRCLETAAVENAFGVFVKDGKATVLHLGMGNAMQTPLDFDAMIAADAKLHPDKVYFVHNHPSGTLKASDQDVALYEYIESYFGKRLQPCIIINTRSGRYVTFVGRDQQIEQHSQNIAGNEVPLETYSFSQQVFSKDYVESDNLLDLSHVASFLSGQRLGARDKFSYLVVSGNLQVMANIHTPYSTIGKADIDELARKMRQDVALFGGRGVIGYGSAKIPKQVLSKLKENFEKIGGVDMIDFVNVRRKMDLSQNLEVTSLAYAYESAFTQNVVELKGEVEKSEIERADKAESKPIQQPQSIIGRLLTEQEADGLITQMVNLAEEALEMELTPVNWEAQFGKDNRVLTPIGLVKMGENQYAKLIATGRERYFGLIKNTLVNPDIILAKDAPVDGAERDSKRLFVKTFVKPDGSRVVHFESVTVQKENMEVSISSHEAGKDRIRKEMQNCNVLHLNEKLSLSSEWCLTKTPEKGGPDLVPTPDKISLDKGITTEDKKQGNASISNRKIDDFGEKIWGARKDILRELAQRMDDVTEASLLELPFAKVWKKPDLKKLVDGGLLTEDDAVVAEAVMQGMIFIPKPRPSKRDQRIAKYYGTKTAVEQWAERVHTGIKMLRDVIVLQGEEKRDCIQKVMEFEENGFKPIGFIAEVIKNIGYTTGEDLSLPAARIEYGYDGKMYIETEAGKRRVHSLEQAGDIAVQLAKIKRGDNDIPFFTNDITVHAEKPIFEKDGRYEVAYLKGRSVTPKYKLFAGSENAEQEAMAFAKDIEADGGVAKVIACKKATGKYETYSIAFRNPLTDERMVHSSYPDMETAEKMLEEHRPEIEDSFRQRLSSEGTMKTEKKKVSQDANFDIYVFRGKYVVGIPPKKSPTGEFLQVSPSFEDRNAVHRWLDENRPQLEHQYATYKADMKKFVYLETRLGDRQGADYRQGKDVTPEMFSSTFGFRGVQFGNWTNDLDRQAALNSTYDALMDLSRVVGKSPRAISLNGELGLAFGARGSGSADAHYEPKMVVINLTKTRGGGSLAHEWWHAMDNYFSRQADVPAGYMTTAKRERVGVRPAVRTAFKSLVEAVVDSPFGKRSARLGTYWGDNREITARLFGEWVGQKLNEKGEYNHFLTTQVREATVAQVRGMNYMLYCMGRNKEELMSREEFDKLPDSLAGFPYPTAEETKTFGRLLDSLYQTMEEKVDVTTGKTMLYDDGVRYGLKEKKQVSCRPSRGCKL